MRRCLSVLALAAGLGLISSGSYSAAEKEKKPADKKVADKKAADKKGADQDAKVDRKELARLVGKLGSEKPEEREAAGKALEAIGAPALDSLRNAVAGTDAELQTAARAVIQKIERRVDSERILTPTLVKFSFKNKLAVDAVAELAKKSHYRINIGGDTSELRKRRVTLDTGEVPFWKAFDQLCLKASLIEYEGRQVPGGVPVPPNGVRPPGANPMIQPGFNPPPGGMPGRPGQPEQAPQIVLEDGNPVELPTTYAGALRIRTLPSDSLTVTQQKGANETLVLLEVTAEPKIQWQQLESVLVDKAIDENDQALVQVKEEAPPKPGVPGAIPGAPALPDPIAPPAPKAPALIRPPMNPMGPGFGPGRLPMNGQSSASQVPIRFTIGEKPSKALKELKGVLVAKVLTPTQTLITVPNILEAADATVKGEAGGSIAVLEVKAEKKGEVKIRVHLELPADVQDPAAAVGMPGGPGIAPLPPRPPVLVPGVLPGAPGGAAAAGKDSFGLSLLDTRGKKFQVAGVSTKRTVNAGVVSREYTLTFQPQGVQGKPAKLIYEAAHSATVEVPFAFADVPLP